MPIYEYACSACGHELEVRQKFSDDPLTHCPKCDAEELQRLVSNSSFALKGSGWYADGYGPKKSGAKTDGGSSDKADKSADSKGDKTDKKPESKKADPPKASTKDSKA